MFIMAMATRQDIPKLLRIQMIKIKWRIAQLLKQVLLPYPSLLGPSGACGSFRVGVGCLGVLLDGFGLFCVLVTINSKYLSFHTNLKGSQSHC